MKFRNGWLLLLLLVVRPVAGQQHTNGQWQSPHTMEALGAAPVALIPFPQEVVWTGQPMKLQRNMSIRIQGAMNGLAGDAVRSLRELLQQCGIQASANGKNTVPRILFEKKRQPVKEGYQLQVMPAVITIRASDAAGFYYGVQTLRQLLAQKTAENTIYGCTITDWPAFGLRGFMHDNGRNFQPVALLKAQLEKLSWYKFNTFHWHLTDNPAWRPESRIYPQLNDPAKRKAGRDPDSTYSFDAIRDLIAFARKRSIRIIPELDMPGHSRYFEPAFGFKMESEQGMAVLEKLIDEFCAQIPAEDCPVIHIGSDEVGIANPAAFIRRMTDRVKRNGRRVMVWNPGLPPEPGTIEQHWRDDGSAGIRNSNNPVVDSYSGYLNYFDAYSLIQRYFFQQICNRPRGDSLAWGGIVCCWPDVRVDDKSRILLHNPVWPGAIAYSEAAWCGRSGYNSIYMNRLPLPGTPANGYFREFESRMYRHQLLFFNNDPFPYHALADLEWTMSGPFHRSREDAVNRAFTPELKTNQRDRVATTVVAGGVFRFNDMLGAKVLSSGVDETVYLTGYVYVKTGRIMHAITGFETAARSNRRSGGIPQDGKWDANGGAVFINGEELAGPTWNAPGANRYLKATWETPANEIPFTDEEFYWSRPPAAIPLQKGWNKIVVRVPRAYKEQNWSFAFVPVKKGRAGNWERDHMIQVRAAVK
ncbi:beta-N-acetylhexosaminidase [Niabella drilacis]|uniref:beta-N-acetylhexosaminidase n=1 Tax=Niabella drilacis (strain DSM 25811 / CCM 8410 / CCUG 62505 / LMG 26954 / E90) TaxID=1285928 RepID=A0A1G6IZL6_NIADE|nr:beta-N-acetylhexosaminidase [Niabella drilacis]SDC11236.1 Glycosyl hydrolase family 20, domain 2 [Niabella drilacis]